MSEASWRAAELVLMCLDQDTLNYAEAVESGATIIDTAIARAVADRDEQAAGRCPTCHNYLADQMAFHLQAEVEESDRVKELRDEIRRTRESMANLPSVPSKEEETKVVVARAVEGERARVMAIFDDYFAPDDDDPMVERCRAALRGSNAS